MEIVDECKFCELIFSSVWSCRTHLTQIHDLYENLERKIVRKVHRQSAEYKQQEDIQLNKNQQYSAKQHVAQRPPGRQELSCERQRRKKKHMKSPHISKTVKRHTTCQEQQLQPLTLHERTIGSLAPQEYKQQEDRQLNKHQQHSKKQHFAQQPPQTQELSCERQRREKKHMKSPHISKKVKPCTSRQEAQLQPLTPQERTIESLAPQEYKLQEDRQLNKHQQQNAKQHVAQRRSQTRKLSCERHPKEKIMESLYISQDTSSSPQNETVEPLYTARDISSSSISSPGVEKSFQETSLYPDLQGSSSSLTIEGPLQDPPLVTFEVPSQDIADLSTPFLTLKRHLQDHSSYQAVKEPSSTSPNVERAPHDLQDHSSFHAVEKPCQELQGPSSTSPAVERVPHYLQDRYQSQIFTLPSQDLHSFSTPFPDIEGLLSLSPVLEGQLPSCAINPHLPDYVHSYSTEPFLKYDDFGYITENGLYVNKHRQLVVQPRYAEPSSGYEGPYSSSQTETAEHFCTSQETNSSQISSPAVEKTSQEPSFSSDLQGPSSSPTIEGLCGNLQNPSFPQTLERPLKDAPSSLNFEVPSHDLHGFSAPFQRLENHSQDLESSSLSLTDIEGPSPALERQLPFSTINSTLSPYAQNFFPHWFFAQLPFSTINSTLSPYAQDFFPRWFFAQLSSNKINVI